MHKVKPLGFGLLIAMILCMLTLTTVLGQDKNNLGWKIAWKSYNASKTDPIPELPEEEGIYIPYRGHNAEAWFDFDGDGNLEFFHDDNNWRKTYVFENDGDNSYAYRWFTDYVDAEGNSLYTGERGITATDLDGDDADELILIRSTPPPGDVNHIPPIRIFKHESGSEEFLPIDWTVAWDECPTGIESGELSMEYTNGAGDWDNDGKGEFGMNYKVDPEYYFAIIEVTPPLTPEAVVFEVEYMIEKDEYMVQEDQNVATINGVDLDGDGYAELWLPQRNDYVQNMFYLDCTGPDTYVEYHWGPTDPRVIMADTTIRVGDQSGYVDLDGDGVKELVGLWPNAATGVGADTVNTTELWVAKINPSDPANLFTTENWVMLGTVNDFLGVPKRSFSTGFFDTGDADADDLPDIYFGLGEDAGSRIVDVEFVGTDWKNPEHYKWYTIINSGVDGGLEDPATPVLGSRGILADGDKDGKPDIWHNNRRDGVNRPAEYVWEFTPVEAPVDNPNLNWALAWKSYNASKTDPIPELPEEEGIYIPYRGHNAEAWFDFDGDGNLEFFHDDNNWRKTYVFENDGDNSYAYRWFTDYVDAEGNSLYTGERGITATDLDGDDADELILIRSTPPPGDVNHIPPIRIFKHESGSEEFLPIDWTVAWDECPTGIESGELSMEYTNGAGDWDNDGKGEFGMNYKVDPEYYFAIIEVTPPLTPEAVVFEVEYMIEKDEYMVQEDQNVATINGVDLDGDGYAELWLPQRNDYVQNMFYLDCTGPDTYVEYHWGPTDPRVIMADTTIRVGDQSGYVDLDGDGVKELVGLWPNAATGVGADTVNTTELWVAKINPSDPANLFTTENWVMLGTVNDFLGVPKRSFSTGFFDTGDADADDLPDIYFGLGEDAGSRIVDVEFVGTDWKNPEHYKWYTIINSGVDGGLEDPATPVLGSRGILADGDKDGKPDIWHNNRRDGVNRPAEYVWEYGGVNSVGPLDNGNLSPAAYELFQNYPNPFNPTTTIAYSLNRVSEVRIDIFNVLGQLVNTLVDAKVVKGKHKVVWNGTDRNGYHVSSGIYFYSLSVNSSRIIKKMMLIR